MDSTPLLAADPPPFFARALSATLLSAAALATMFSVAVPLPESVEVPFVVATARSADPVVVPASGEVVHVAVTLGQTVTAGDVLVEVRSEASRVQAEALREATRAGQSAESRVALTTARLDGEVDALAAELEGLDARAASLRRTLPIAERRWTAMVARQEQAAVLRAGGAASESDLLDASIAVDEALLALESMRRDLRETASRRAAVGRKLAAQRAAAEAEQQALDQELAGENTRLELLRELAASEGATEALRAPCAGVVAELSVQRAGAWVSAGREVARVACDGEPLVAELAIPGAAAGRVSEGQVVRLRYSAFPYLRFGVHTSTLDWVSPTAVEDTFAGRVPIGAAYMEVQGKRWTVRPGMGGTAQVELGRKPLIAWAFEPVAVLFEDGG